MTKYHCVVPSCWDRLDAVMLSVSLELWILPIIVTWQMSTPHTSWSRLWMRNCGDLRTTVNSRTSFSYCVEFSGNLCAKMNDFDLSRAHEVRPTILDLLHSVRWVATSKYVSGAGSVSRPGQTPCRPDQQPVPFTHRQVAVVRPLQWCCEVNQ